MNQVCFMCDAPATTREHVPPRSLFPEPKDLPEGIDLRKDLITVPSCDMHNSATSRDDEYFLYISAINIPANETAENHFLSKLLRAIERRPALINDLLSHPTPILAVDSVNGCQYETIAIQIDNKRVERVLEKISRGIYFHHYGNRWLDPLLTHCEFLLASLDPDIAPKINRPLEHIFEVAEQTFTDVPMHGSNPEVFQYQVYEEPTGTDKMFRYHFYGAVRALAVFKKQSVERNKNVSYTANA